MIVLENGDILEGDSTSATETDFTLHGLDNNTLKQLADGQLAATKGTIYTADSTDVISSIILVNAGVAHNHVNLYFKAFGGTSRRLIPKDLQLEPGYSLHFDGSKMMVLDTIGGIISSASAVGIISDIAYAVSWNGITTIAPSKNAVYDEMELKAPKASPTFTGTVTIPTPFTLGAVSVLPTGTELNFVDGVTSAIQTQLDLKAPLISPAFTTPNLGTPSAGTLTSCTGLPAAGVVGTAIVSGGALGTPSAGTLTNCSGLPAAGVVGTAIVSGGALGTPSSGTLTNCLGLPAAGVTGTAAVLGDNTFTGNQTLSAGKSIVLPAVGIADQTWCGITEAGTSVGNIAFGEVCYFVTATSKWDLAKANAASTSANKLGICVLAAVGSAATVMLLYGKIRADSLFDTFTIGAPLYISAATAGKIVTAAPTGTTDFVVRKAGFANSGDEVFFNPSDDYITLV